VNAATLALAAGALLTMITDTMLPEAFAETHELAGLLSSWIYFSLCSIKNCLISKYKN